MALHLHQQEQCMLWAALDVRRGRYGQPKFLTTPQMRTAAEANHRATCKGCSEKQDQARRKSCCVK